MSETPNPQEIKQQYEELQQLVEDLVSIRVGAPIYEIHEGAMNHFEEKRPGDSHTRVSNLQESKRIVHGVILPTGAEREFVLLGVDNSAIIVKSALSSGDGQLLSNGAGIEIDTKAHYNIDRPIANIAFSNSGLSNYGKVLLDISQNPEETTESIGKAIKYAKAEAKRIQENRQKALPNVINKLRGFFENSEE